MFKNILYVYHSLQRYALDISAKVRPHSFLCEIGSVWCMLLLQAQRQCHYCSAMHYQSCARWKCALTLHNTVKWQKEWQIKVQLQSSQSISYIFFPISSHSATVWPVKLGLATVEWEAEREGFLGLLLFDDSLGVCLPLHRCPLLIHWNWSPDICTFYFHPILQRIFWSQHYDREIY